MIKKTICLIMLVILGGMGSIILNANENLHYGYISYLDGDAKVIRLDGSETRATINLPLVPGDRLVTGEKDRCEIQFDNGTVMRLDKNTVLRIKTILAEALTTSRKLTTLYLDRGEIYSIVNSYQKENFQVITFDSEEGTSIYVERGSVKALFGKKLRNLKRETVKRKKGFRVSLNHQLVEGVKRNLEFVIWNEKINKNFKELHYGVSRVPKPIYRYSKGIINFAEKWSTLYGEWMYDDIFGYVWHPYQKQFAMSQRPFYHAQYVDVNGKLFLVPTQKWGWAPAHLGNWVWMNKKGWVWIPGDAFSTGVGNSFLGFIGLARFFSPYIFWDQLYYNQYRGFEFDYWLRQVYGSRELYKLYRSDPKRFYATRIPTENPGKKRKISMRGVPKHIITIIKRMNKAPLSVLEKKLFGNKRAFDFKLNRWDVRRTRPYAAPAVKPLGRAITTKVIADNTRLTNFRTWCPDKRWGQRNNLDVRYSSRTNAVICKELGLNSNHMDMRTRIALTRGNMSELIPSMASKFGSRARGSSSPALSAPSGNFSANTSRTSSGGTKGGKKE